MLSRDRRDLHIYHGDITGGSSRWSMTLERRSLVDRLLSTTEASDMSRSKAVSASDWIPAGVCAMTSTETPETPVSQPRRRGTPHIDGRATKSCRRRRAAPLRDSLPSPLLTLENISRLITMEASTPIPPTRSNECRRLAAGQARASSRRRSKGIQALLGTSLLPSDGRVRSAASKCSRG